MNTLQIEKKAKIIIGSPDFSEKKTFGNKEIAQAKIALIPRTQILYYSEPKSFRGLSTDISQGQLGIDGISSLSSIERKLKSLERIEQLKRELHCTDAEMQKLQNLIDNMDQPLTSSDIKVLEFRMKYERSVEKMELERIINQQLEELKQKLDCGDSEMKIMRKLTEKQNQPLTFDDIESLCFIIIHERVHRETLNLEATYKYNK